MPADRDHVHSGSCDRYLAEGLDCIGMQQYMGAIFLIKPFFGFGYLIYGHYRTGLVID